jgi:para-nitrobenzyl esterase
MDRRSFLFATLAGVPALFAKSGNPLILPSSGLKISPVVAKTIYGKVQGYDFNGVKIFRGLPYGAATEGMGRFLP